MGVYRFAVGLAVATFALTIFGGLVSTTGSGLACPDWPLCEGEWIPPMVNGKEYEHTHRLVASFVGAMTFGLLALIWKHRRRDRFLLRAAAVASVLVVVQALLGALTVILKLPWYVSSSHLAVASLFFATTVSLAFWTRPVSATAAQQSQQTPNRDAQWLRFIYPLTAVVFLQLVVGGVMRHLGAGLACGLEVLTCNGSVWPHDTHYGSHVHMLHRLLGMVSGVGLLALAVGLTRARGVSSSLRGLGIALGVGVVAQIVLGFWSVLSVRSIAVMTVHSSLGFALFAGVVSMVWLARPPRKPVQTEVVGMAGRFPNAEPA